MTTRTYTQTTENARQYTSSGRAAAAAVRMLGADWWRVVNVYIDAYVIDTYSGYLAK